jgi:hypothetical protein
MVDRYGEKRVEKVFETQLSLLVQSLGFAVVRTRSGERRVDLLCIAGGPGEFTFLLEAKTSARPYSFSTADERALSEYVRDVRRSVAGNIPALRFVLLVGASPAKTLASKLQRFEAENSVPTRFMKAGALVRLRAGLPGPVRAPTLEARLLASPSVVPDEVVDDVITKQRDVEMAHTGFVRTLLGSSDWPVQANKGPTPIRRARGNES